jgi:hypothetical protein
MLNKSRVPSPPNPVVFHGGNAMFFIFILRKKQKQIYSAEKIKKRLTTTNII